MWIVVRTKPNSEKWAALNLTRQGYDYYLPQIRVERKHRGVSILKAEPLFRHYLFVTTDGRWYSLLSTFGISSVIMQGSKPAEMRDREIAALREREVDGYITLPPRPTSQFQPGDRVRVKAGAYKHYEGICEGADAKARERVLLEYLGRKVPFLIPVADLEPIPG
jgi:transcriptional antiterminator RfaH